MIQRVAETDTAILVRDMASKLIRSCDEHDIHGRSGKRRVARRTSVSTTPPSLISSQSMPPTPTNSRSSHSTIYFMDRERPRSFINGPVPFRATREESVTPTPTSGSSTGASTPTLTNGSTSSIIAKSRLPRTTSNRSSRQSLIYTSPKKEESVAPSPSHLSVIHADRVAQSPVMIPNSRRRRQTSGSDARWT